MVTTSPIPFAPIATTGPTARANIDGTQTRQGPSIDGNFAAVNPWAATLDSQVDATLVTGIVTATAPWTTANRVNGMIIGNGLVALNLTLIYGGASTTANSLGHFGYLTMGAVTDVRFRPATNKYLHFVGLMTHGLACIEFNGNGTLRLSAGSFPSQPLNNGNFVVVSAVYAPR